MSMGFGFSLPAYTGYAASFGAGATLALDFTSGNQTLDPRITFTRSTTATYFNSAGVLSSAAINAPRFDYDPVTLTLRGLLIEESRTNLLTYSEQFDNAAWTKSNSSITANTIVSPDGTTTADTLTDNATSGVHRVAQTITTSNNNQLVLSCFLKYSTMQWVSLSAATNTGQWAGAKFDVQNGVLGSTSQQGTSWTADSSSITSVGSGWYRCVLVFTPGNSGSLGVYVNGATDGTTFTTSQRGAEVYSGTGSEVFLWGAQLEAGAFATSYIPTVASQVTRAADSAVMTGTNFSSWYNAVEGTLYSEASTYDVSAARIGFAISDGTASNRIQAGNGGGARGFVSAGGVTQMTQALASATFSNNTASKVSLAYELNNGNAAANGTIGTLDTAMTIPVVTQARIGGLTTTQSPLNGHVRRIAYYPRRLANAELQGITS